MDLMKTSNSQLNKISTKLKAELNLYISETIVPMLKGRVRETFGHRNEKEITIIQTGENVEFKYSTSEGDGYLLDHILLEFGARNTTEPSTLQEIKPYIIEELQNIVKAPMPTIAVLSPIRTFWEKATLAHVECHRKRLSTTHGYRMSRHWYDLYWLARSNIGSQALRDSAILKEVLCVKKAFYNSPQAFYDECIEGRLKLVPETRELIALEKDYKEMIQSGMFLKVPDSFECMIKTIKELENKINQTRLSQRDQI